MNVTLTMFMGRYHHYSGGQWTLSSHQLYTQPEVRGLSIWHKY